VTPPHDESERTPVPHVSEPLLDEAQIARLFQRAAELDAARVARVNANEARQIAEEIGISAESFEQALQELTAPAGAVSREDASRVPEEPGPVQNLLQSFSSAGAIARTAAVTFAGFVLGWSGPAFNPWEVWRTGGEVVMVRDTDGVVSLVALGVTILLGIATLLEHRRARSLLHYQLDVMLLWGAFTQGLMLGHGRFWDDIVAVTFFLWSTFAVIGGFFVARGDQPLLEGLQRMRTREPEEEPETRSLPAGA
jgi:hypothetical protein